MMRSWILMGALLCAGATPTAAQWPGDSARARDSAVARALGGFSEGQQIRVALLRSRWAGRFIRVGGDTLFLGPSDQPPMALRFNAIDTAWRAARATGTGARIGALTGGILGAAFMGAIAGNLGEGDNMFAAVGAGAAGGALGGAGAGALVGRMFRRWRRVFP